MTISYKKSIYTSIIFGTMFLFIVVFFLVVGASNFLSDRWNYVISALVVGAGLVTFVGMLLLTNKKSNVVDERDHYIQKKANSMGLLLTLLYVFLVSMGLFVHYQYVEVVPVSWMWFMAYSAFSFGYFITSLGYIYYYHHEE